MRRIIMAIILAVAFIPGVASAQMPDPNKGMEMLNNLQRDKKDICTLNDGCATIYDNAIDQMRRSLDAQRRLSEAERVHDRDLQLRIRGELVAIGQDIVKAGGDLNGYLKTRGIVASAK